MAKSRKLLRLLPTIHGIDIKKIHHFSDQIVYCVQSLETMGKLEQVNGYVSMILDKLPGIRGDLVRTNEEWETWDFVKLYDYGLGETQLNCMERMTDLVKSGIGCFIRKLVKISVYVFIVVNSRINQRSVQRFRHLMRGGRY